MSGVLIGQLYKIYIGQCLDSRWVACSIPFKKVQPGGSSVQGRTLRKQ